MPLKTGISRRISTKSYTGDVKLAATTLNVSQHWKSRWVNGDPCKYDDDRCMDDLSLKYVNDLRIEYDFIPFKLGTTAMLQNAIEH